MGLCICVCMNNHIQYISTINGKKEEERERRERTHIFVHVHQLASAGDIFFLSLLSASTGMP